MIPLQDAKTSDKFPFWTIAIIATNVVIFFLELTTPNIDAFIEQYALIPSMVDFFKPQTFYPFITSQFLHGGFLHIIFNMWFLWIFGDNIEGKLGYFLFPLFYLFSGIVGSALQFIFIPDSDIPMLGASGAIAGVLGAYLAFFGNNKIKTLIFIIFFITIIEIPASFLLFYWFILQLFAGAISVSPGTADVGGIAYFAHVGGFAAGWLAGKFFSRFNFNWPDFIGFK